MVMFQIDVTGVDASAVSASLPIADVDGQSARHLGFVAVVQTCCTQVAIGHALLRRLTITGTLRRTHVRIRPAPHSIQRRRSVVRQPPALGRAQLEEPGRDQSRELRHINTSGQLTLGMLVWVLNSMRYWTAKLSLQFTHLRQRIAKIHHAVDTLDDVAVAWMQFDDGDPLMLRRQHPMIGLRIRPALTLREYTATPLEPHNPQEEHAEREAESTARPRLQGTGPAGPGGHGAAILSRHWLRQKTSRGRTDSRVGAQSDPPAFVEYHGYP